MLFKYLFAWDLRHLIDILKYIVTVYKFNSKRNSKYYLLCEKYANYSQLIIKLIPISYFAAGSLVVGVSMYEYAATGILKPPFSLYFPNADGHTMPDGDMLMFMSNICLMAVSIVSVSTYDILIQISFCNVPLLSAIIVQELHEVQEKLEHENMSRIEIKRRLLKIIVMQTKYKE